MPTVLARYSSLKLHDHFRVSDDLPLKVNDIVVLRTKRGVESGQIKALDSAAKMKPEEGIAGEVMRKSTIEDAAKLRELRANDTKPIVRLARELARKYKLPMHVETVERILSGDKVIIYFQSEERLDFREMVKDLTTQLNTRIEMRQVGARDAARLTGDVSTCGQELCCISYIVDFVPVSMKMAKNQRTSLDPGKISGMCGRLKCCLKYEDDLYSELRKGMPLDGQPCKCDGHDCRVCGVDILGQKVTVDFGEGEREVRDVKEITFDPNLTEKDVRQFERERRAEIDRKRAERIARGERRAQERGGGDRRQTQNVPSPERRTADSTATISGETTIITGPTTVPSLGVTGQQPTGLVPDDTRTLQKPASEADSGKRIIPESRAAKPDTAQQRDTRRVEIGDDTGKLSPEARKMVEEAHSLPASETAVNEVADEEGEEDDAEDVEATDSSKAIIPGMPQQPRLGPDGEPLRRRRRRRGRGRNTRRMNPGGPNQGSNPGPQAGPPPSPPAAT
ncbi:MAG: hypothetical protein IT462_04430 [Planctomycetes bacterium]|nr:hypothetical protein [Planctomycetota bacterium]